MWAGHFYYFLEDVYPRMTGRRPLKTPGLVKALFPGDDGVRIVRTPPPAAPHAFPAPGVVPEPGRDAR
jgi:Derlin-2/3